MTTYEMEKEIRVRAELRKRDQTIHDLREELAEARSQLAERELRVAELE